MRGSVAVGGLQLVANVPVCGERQLSEGSRVKRDLDVVQGGRFALHDRPLAQVGLYTGIVRRHHGDDALA